MGTRKDKQNGGMNLRDSADWQELMRRNMENYGEAEPEGLWAAVASGLKAAAGVADATGARAGASASRGAAESGASASRIAPGTSRAAASASRGAAESGASASRLAPGTSRAAASASRDAAESGASASRIASASSRAGAVSRRRRRFYYGAGAFAIAAAALALFLILPVPSRLSPVSPDAVAVADLPGELPDELPASLPASETGGLPAFETDGLHGSGFGESHAPAELPGNEGLAPSSDRDLLGDGSASSVSGRTSGAGNLPPVVSVDEPEPDCVEAPASSAADPDSSAAASGEGSVEAEADALSSAGQHESASGEGSGSREDVSGSRGGSSAALELEEYLRELETKEAKARSGRTRLAVALSGAVGTSSSSSSGYDAFYGSSVPMSLNSPIVGNLVSQQFSAVLLENNNRSVNSDRRFYQPVALELSLAHDLGSRLYLQGGLAYTCLISELVSGSESTHYDTRQSVHMLGVPLKLGAHLLENQLFELNVSAGGMLEKALYARSVTRFVFEGQKPVSTSTRLSDDPLYWSVNASVSALYKLSRSVGIYFEPGLSYHFNNGSFLETIYQARPLNLQLTLGLRFAL